MKPARLQDRTRRHRVHDIARYGAELERASAATTGLNFNACVLGFFSRWGLATNEIGGCCGACSKPVSQVSTLAEVRARVRCVGATADAAIMASRDIIVTRVSQKI
jgi:hypothetical protein